MQEPLLKAAPLTETGILHDAIRQEPETRMMITISLKQWDQQQH